MPVAVLVELIVTKISVMHDISMIKIIEKLHFFLQECSYYQLIFVRTWYPCSIFENKVDRNFGEKRK